MQPYFKDNPAYSVSTTSTAGPGGTTRTVTDRVNINQHMEVAPQLWLGYLSDSGFGGRVRWWYFREGTNQGISIPAGPAGGDTYLTSAGPLGFSAFADNDSKPASLAVTTKLQIQVWDIEAMNSYQASRWNLLVAGGVRITQIDQRYNAYAVGDSGGGTGAIAAAVLSGHNFYGAGPTIALEARRALGCSGLSLYSMARGAVLYGSGKQQANDIFASGGSVFVDSSRDRRSPVLPVGELELGLEYGRNIGSAHAFGQFALVGQQWWGAGNASRSSYVTGFGVPAPGGSPIDNDLGLLGFSFRLGLNY
jgi:hypothetical protein